MDESKKFVAGNLGLISRLIMFSKVVARPARDDVDMRVRHRLVGLGTIVDQHVDRRAAGGGLDRRDQPGQRRPQRGEGLDRQVGQVARLEARDQQAMAGIGRADVHEGDEPDVVEHRLRRHFAGDDAGEEAGHAAQATPLRAHATPSPLRSASRPRFPSPAGS